MYGTIAFPFQNNAWEKSSKLTKGDKKRKKKKIGLRKQTLYDVLSCDLPESIFNWNKFFAANSASLQCPQSRGNP